MGINHSGIVLISTLLFLVLLTLLAVNGLQISLLETKMSSNYMDNISLLHQAEINLRNKEVLLHHGVIPLGATLISTDICGVNLYRINVNYGKEILQGTYAVVSENTNNCDHKSIISLGRQSWVLLK